MPRRALHTDVRRSTILVVKTGPPHLMAHLAIGVITRLYSAIHLVRGTVTWGYYGVLHFVVECY